MPFYFQKIGFVFELEVVQLDGRLSPLWFGAITSTVVSSITAMMIMITCINGLCSHNRKNGCYHCKNKWNGENLHLDTLVELTRCNWKLKLTDSYSNWCHNFYMILRCLFCFRHTLHAPISKKKWQKQNISSEAMSKAYSNPTV